METLHQYLKESTRPNHTAAESHPFQGALANARLSIPAYVDYLQQLRELHERFEAKLRDASGTNPSVKHVVQPEHYQLTFLEKDLQALKANKANALPCVQEFTESNLFAQEPASLLGVLYVLLGSKHGGKFIAHNVKQAYNLDEAGYTYFAPYGENFREIWQKFTAGLNELELTEAQRQRVLEGASHTFDFFGKLGEEIWQRSLATK